MGNVFALREQQIISAAAQSPTNLLLSTVWKAMNLKEGKGTMAKKQSWAEMDKSNTPFEKLRTAYGYELRL